MVLPVYRMFTLVLHIYHRHLRSGNEFYMNEISKFNSFFTTLIYLFFIL